MKLNNDALNNIQLVATDCDGVLTDGGMYYTEQGDCMKRFCVLDGLGFVRLREHGIKTAIITAEDNLMVKKRAEKLNVDFLILKQRDKLQAIMDLCSHLSILPENVTYIGDDFLDIPAIEAVGFGCAPPNAMPQVKEAADYITAAGGGYGCFREVAEILLNIR